MTDDVNDDFQPVRHTGGKVTFTFSSGANGRTCSIGWEHATPYPAALFGIYVLLPDGLPLTIAPLGGIGDRAAPPPVTDSLLVFVGSDREGLFGRACPSCERYFRTQSAGPTTRCPYCCVLAETPAFLSTPQVTTYIRMYVDRYLEAAEQGQNATIDLDALTEQSGGNRPPRDLAEERQQTKFRCVKCKTVSDISGRYGSCPRCGRRNSFALLSKTLDALEDRVKTPRHPASERELRDAEWRSVVRDCVSAFEGFARDLLERLITIPATPSRRAAVSSISFHSPIVAAERLRAFFEIDILAGVDADEREFVARRFLRRHVYEHCSGIADQEYVAASGDTSVRVGHLIRERSSNVSTFIGLVRKIATNFDEGFHSISSPQRPKKQGGA